MKFLGKNRQKNRNKRVFLDYASITPTDKKVAKKMKEYESIIFANPSALYTEGLKAKKAIEEAKSNIAKILGAKKNEIIFTSGGTEGNNLAIFGVFEAVKLANNKPHIITTTIEHPSILEVCKEIERRGGEVTYIEVSEDGVINPKDIKESIKPNTILVSIMYANNEIGTVQEIHEIGRIIKEWRHKNNTSLPYFHTDACQATLYEEINVNKLGVDVMTLDGIKMYGPKGIGVLYVRSGVNIKPIYFGGGQEKGLRSGTENLPAIMGLAEAFIIANKMKDKENKRLIVIRNYAIKKILEKFNEAKLNGSQKMRLPNNINICFPNLDAEFAVIFLNILGVSASYSSSCRNLKEDSSSYVVEAIGRKNCSTSSLRFTLGRENTKKDIDRLIKALQKIIK